MASSLTLEAPITILDDILKYIYIYCGFSGIISLDGSCDSSTKQTIHMKCQDLFSKKKT